MLRLILMRHAKSSWSDASTPDHERPLNERGRRASAAIGAWLDRNGYRPRQALISTAERTRETWDRMRGALGEVGQDFRRDLYHAEPAALMHALKGARDTPLLLLAHQPGIGEFAARIVGAAVEDPDFARYPTAATAIIDFDAAQWTDVDWGSGRLEAFVVPRALERDS